MKKKYLLLLLLFQTVVVLAQPIANWVKSDDKTTHFGTSLNDEYAALENYNSKAVTDWVALQNQATAKQLESFGDKNAIVSKLKQYDWASSNSIPQKKGKYFYMSIRRDKDEPAILMMTKSLRHLPVDVVNPYKIYKDKNVVLSGISPSKNSRYLAYQISRNGSDIEEIRFTDLDNLDQLGDVLTNVKSNMAWNGDKGIFYKKNSNQEVFARDSTYQLYYHKLGKPQSEDQLVFDAAARESYVDFFTKQNKLIVIETSKDKQTQRYYWSPIESEAFALSPFIEDEPGNFNFLTYADGRIYFANDEYDWGEVRSFALNNRSDEKVLIPQIYSHLLIDTDFIDDYVVCTYKTLGRYYLSVYDKEGNFIRKFDAPAGMKFRINFYDSESKCLFVSFYSYTLSFHNFKLNLETGDASPFFTDYSPPKPILFPLDYFETKTITYKSRDQKDIPITIVHKKGLTLNGNNPTLFSAYGGFGVVSGPRFDTGLLYFLEQGGVYAYAEVRGGGEKGLNWHKEGKGLKKINTFNDFIDGAEFLISQKYTSPQKLAITGASQGGLLVGVAITQRPDLFKVAIPEMGAFDMIKFESYTVGKYHVAEYGNVATEEGFRSLLSYSPYHNTKEDVNYPAMLIITSENDDRVPPIHSYKFAAKLQNREAQKNPVFLKTLGNSGHYGKISTYQDRLEQKAEFYSFLLHYLNN